MQPCTVCGGGAVNQAGYCQRCGTYRGVPAAGPGYLGPPLAPASANRRRSYLVPLAALGTTLAVLVAAIGVVLVVRYTANDPDRLTADPSTSPTSARSLSPDQPPSSPIDPCVIGRWQVESYEEDIALDEPFGRTRFTNDGLGAVVELREDGLGVTDYGDGTRFTGRVSGIDMTLTITGRVTYRYRAIDGTVSFSNVQADGTVTLTAPGLEPQSQPLTAEFDPANYQCSGDTLIQSTSSYTARMFSR